MGRWIRFISQGVNAVLVGANQETDFRLLGGGTWSWSATSGVLAWSDTAYLGMPGYADTANTIAAGSVTLTAGQIAYVAANVPFSTTGTTTSGSAVVTNLAFESGIVAGAAVTGPGIASGSSVASISQADSSLTLSKPATASAANVNLVFGGTNASLTVQAANTPGFVPSANTVVIARCYAQDGVANAVQVGVNAGQMRLLDTERKPLLGSGYATSYRAPAGDDLPANCAVYLSKGGLSDGNRTAGAVYPLTVNGPLIRATFAGVTTTATTSGNMAEVVASGRLNYLAASLTPGAVYFASATPGAISATAPTAAGSNFVAVGTALSASTLLLAPSAAPPATALSGTTTYASTVAAPSFVSTAGFRSQMSFGSIAITNAPASAQQTLQRVVPKDNATTALEPAVRIMGGTGSILGVLVRSATQSTGNLYIYKNGSTLIGQLGLATAQASTAVWLTKGSQSFAQGDTLYVTFQPGATANLQLSVDFIVEFSA